MGEKECLRRRTRTNILKKDKSGSLAGKIDDSLKEGYISLLKMDVRAPAMINTLEPIHWGEAALDTRPKGLSLPS